jgi:hypothetical protein
MIFRMILQYTKCVKMRHLQNPTYGMGEQSFSPLTISMVLYKLQTAIEKMNAALKNKI